MPLRGCCRLWERGHPRSASRAAVAAVMADRRPPGGNECLRSLAPARFLVGSCWIAWRLSLLQVAHLAPSVRGLEITCFRDLRLLPNALRRLFRSVVRVCSASVILKYHSCAVRACFCACWGYLERELRV